MVIDSLANAARYYPLHPDFQKAFEHLQARVGQPLPAERQELDGDRVYVMSIDGKNRGTDDLVMEAHEKYIDIHCTLGGSELFGWKPTPECTLVHQPYDAAGDAILFKDQPTVWTTLLPGTFAIVWPEDAHAPMVGEGPVQKSVVKIAVTWIADGTTDRCGESNGMVLFGAMNEIHRWHRPVTGRAIKLC